MKPTDMRTTAAELPPDIRVAVVHYWFTAMRGGEKVVEEILGMFPQAEIVTHIFRPKMVSELIRSRPVRTTFIDRLPMSERLYPLYLGLMPRALEALDMRDFDLVISSESGPAKGVITRPDALHICYCHSPMRYIWDIQPHYLETAGLAGRLYLRWVSHLLRMWDRTSANGVDYFVANSDFVARRIAKVYRRESVTIYPPVNVDLFEPAPSRGEHFVLAGQLVHYKRADLAVEAFNRLGLPLHVVGSGPMLKRLKRTARPNVSFVDGADPEVFRRELATSRALVFPGEEDFGIIPVEAQASGVPVIAFGKGGARETVRGLVPGETPLADGQYTGVFFLEQTPEALAQAVGSFSELEHIFRPGHCRDNALPFSASVFRERFGGFVAWAWTEFHSWKQVLPGTGDRTAMESN
jgi:glycosyltransferase involved in cell wall biosynthesis